MMYDAKDFPACFTSGGEEYPIHTDFREWIRFEQLIQDGDVPEELKTVIALRLIFADNIPDDIIGAIEFVYRFYRGGSDIIHINENDSGGALESRRVYDLEYDSEYIFAAFMQQYGINLAHTEYMHWWEFKALFKGLCGCKINDIMSYRAADISEDMSDGRKVFLMDMQELYELPVSVTEQRKLEKQRKYLNG